MIKTMLVGLGLAVTAAVALTLSSVFDLELQPFVLAGIAAGAIAARVSDRSGLADLGGLILGFAVAWLGYLLRATYLPEGDLGATLAVVLILLGCALVAAVSQGRVPLWSVLLGTAVLALAYETTLFPDADTYVSSSLAPLTSLLLAAAAGFLVAGLFPPEHQHQKTRLITGTRESRTRASDTEDNTPFDDLLTTPSAATEGNR